MIMKVEEDNIILEIYTIPMTRIIEDLSNYIHHSEAFFDKFERICFDITFAI